MADIDLLVDKTLGEIQQIAESQKTDPIYITSQFLKKLMDNLATSKPEELENVIAMLELTKFRWLSRLYEAEKGE